MRDRENIFEGMRAQRSDRWGSLPLRSGSAEKNARERGAMSVYRTLYVFACILELRGFLRSLPARSTVLTQSSRARQPVSSAAAPHADCRAPPRASTAPSGSSRRPRLVAEGGRNAGGREAALAARSAAAGAALFRRTPAGRFRAPPPGPEPPPPQRWLSDSTVR